MAKQKLQKQLKEKKKSTNLFDYIKWLTSEKKDWNELSFEEQKGFNVYMVNKILSMNIDLCEAINDMQEYTASMNKEMAWRLYKTILPNYNSYNKYIKATPIDNIDEKDINIFKKYFECTEKEAIEYLSLLNKKGLEEEIKKIKDNYQY